MFIHPINASTEVTNIDDAMIQPNTIDLRVNRVFKIGGGPMHMDENTKKHRKSIEVLPDEDGNYLVFVEIKRDKNYYMKMEKILKDIRNITNITDWKFSSYKHSIPKDFNKDNIKANVTLDRRKYKAIFMNSKPTVDESIKRRMKFLVNY